MKTIELIYDTTDNYFVKEAFNTLRTNLIFSGKGIKTVVVTSCFAHEGKSTVSFELAHSLAEAGKRVLLVDADLRKSVMVTRHTKERGICGLSQLLSGQVTLENAIYHTQTEGMDVVFSGPYPPNPTELIGQPAFKEFLRDVRDAYDYVLIDAPPLGLVIDAAVIGSSCDGSIIVINAGHVKYRIARTVKGQLEKSGCKVLGVVLNQATRRRSSGHGFYQSKYQAYHSMHQPVAAPAPQPRPTQPRPAVPAGTAAARPAPAPQQRPAGQVRPAPAPQRPAQANPNAGMVRRPAPAPQRPTQPENKSDT